MTLDYCWSFDSLSDPDHKKWAVALLCGGAGSRMGSPKGLLTTPAGELLAARVLSMLPPGKRDVLLLSGRVHGQLRPLLMEQGSSHWNLLDVEDHPDLDGPQAGLAALSARLLPEQGVVVLAVDMPWVSVGLIEAIIGHAEGRPAAIKDHHGKMHPFPMVLPPGTAAEFTSWALRHPEAGPVQYLKQHGRLLPFNELDLDESQLDDLDHPHQFQTWVDKLDASSTDFPQGPHHALAP